MSITRPELHEAQQIRRGKSRIQNSSQHLEDFPNNLEQLSLRPGLNLHLLQVRSVRNANLLYEPACCSSEMVNFSTASNPISFNRNTMECQGLGEAEPSRLMMPQFASFPHSSDPASSSIRSSPEEQCEARNFGNWRNSGSDQGCDWMSNYACSSVANERNPSSNFVAEVNNVSACQLPGMSRYNEFTDVQSSLNHSSGEMAIRESQRQFGEMQHPSPLYLTTLQDIVKSASFSDQGSEMVSLMQQTGHGIWVENGNELPNYRNQSNQLRFGNASSWTNRTVDNSLRCNIPLGSTDKKVDEDSSPLSSDSNNQGLSLSLSSNAHSALSSQFGERCSKDPQSILNPSFISKDCDKSLQNMVVGLGIPSHTIYRNVGPLGPFTGYASVLKSSNFLKPAQQLLDEFCCLASPKLKKGCDAAGRVFGQVRASTSADANAKERGVGLKGINSRASSSMFYSSNENGNSGDGGAGSSFSFSYRPEYQHKMAKFLCMQDEVTNRYKLYYQQMQMVVSSFEFVAGLSSATPYISMALKSVSRHFRYLENAISDELKRIREILGVDWAAPSIGTSSKFDSYIVARLKYLDQRSQKNQISDGNTGFRENQQHAWRPSKGLPERSVAILRAWLFEHFLHPYPTDIDKQLLATQTGLSRNQVSNWFINARVRVWRPMVEEIHMLEAKGLLGSNQNSSKNEGTSAIEGANLNSSKNEGTSATEGANQNSSKHEGTSAIEGASQSRVDQAQSRFGMRSIPDKQFQCLEMGFVDCNGEVEGLHAELGNQEKRSKLECQVTSSMDGTLMGFVPYRRGKQEVAGLGPVSLTLGLRHGVEGAQNQQQQLQEQQQLSRHFGGQMTNDFVG